MQIFLNVNLLTWICMWSYLEGTERTKLGEKMDQGQGVNRVVVKRGRGKGSMVEGLKNKCPGSEG